MSDDGGASSAISQNELLFLRRAEAAGSLAEEEIAWKLGSLDKQIQNYTTSIDEWAGERAKLVIERQGTQQKLEFLQNELEAIRAAIAAGGIPNTP